MWVHFALCAGGVALIQFPKDDKQGDHDDDEDDAVDDDDNNVDGGNETNSG